MNQIIAIAAGGSAGALARFWVANGLYAWLGRDFPHGTLFVNVSGCLLMGLLSELALQRFAIGSEFRSAVLIGFLGAYTTFSTFAIETLFLFEQGALLKALLNVFLSVALCLAAGWIGLVLGRSLFAGNAWLWLGADLPWSLLSASLGMALLAGLACEKSLRDLAWPEPARTGLLIAVMGLVATGATLACALHLGDGKAGLRQLPGLFALNALGSGLSVWAGLWLGRHL